MLESKVSQIIKNYTEYQLVINFQGTGKTYFTPFAYNSDVLNSTSQYFYDKISAFVPSTYKIGSKYNITNTEETGTLLDSVYFKGGYSLEIAIGESANVNNIEEEAKLHLEFVTNTLTELFSEPIVGFLTANETIKNSKNYYSIVDFNLPISNPRPVSIDFSFIIQLLFNNNSEFSYNYTKTSKSPFNNKNSFILQNETFALSVNNVLNGSGTINPYTYCNYTFVYYKLVESANNTFSIKYQISPKKESYFFYTFKNSLKDLTIEVTKLEEPEDIQKRNIVIGLLFLIFICVILTIIFCVLRKTSQPLLSQES